MWQDWSEWVVDLTNKIIPLQKIFDGIITSAKNVAGFLKNPIGFVVNKIKNNQDIAQKKSRPGRFQQYAGDGIDPSETTINIKVSSDSGSNAVVEGIKSTGNVKPNVSSVGFVGAN